MSSLLLEEGKFFSGRNGEMSIKRWNSDMEETDMALQRGTQESHSQPWKLSQNYHFQQKTNSENSTFTICLYIKHF